MEGITNNREQYIKQLLIAFLREQSVEYTDWMQTAGNITEYEYYTSTEAGNPSGDKNIKTVTYKKGTDIKLIQTFEYDTNNDIVKVTAQ